MATSPRLNHVAVVVEDLETALAFWRDALDLTVSGTEDNAVEAVRVAFLPVGEGQIELLEPTTDDSGVARYLAKRGPGMHHLCLEVPDIEALMQQLAEHGIELINETPRLREDGTRYAFVHPRATGGVLVELYESGKATGD
ncbi:MAG: methylmalonyl-CoA epimerase [Anaerolineae bacterium]